MKNQIPPIDSTLFSDFIRKSKIFEKTGELMKQYLSNWYIESKDDFLECMGAEIDVVLSSYTFNNSNVSLVKNFNFDEPHQDYIYCVIDIRDKSGFCVTSYRSVYDFDLNVEDDMLC